MVRFQMRCYKVTKWRTIKIALVVQCCVLTLTVIWSLSNKDFSPEKLHLRTGTQLKRRSSKNPGNLTALSNTQNKGFIPKRLHLRRTDTKLERNPKSTLNLTLPSDALPSSNVTIVTGYFDIGYFRKGRHGLKYKPSDYLNWLKIFERISNPVMAFFGDRNYQGKFRKLRVREPSYMTKIEIVQKDRTWPFPLRPKLEKMFQNVTYLKHEPRTVNPDYGCVRHIKYELMGKAIRRNAFNTPYYAWLDVGLFHNIANYRANRFAINIPPNFNQTKVAYAYSKELGTVKDPKTIVERNHAWSNGGFFIAKSEVMARWVQQYKAAAEKMLKSGWFSGDEQVLYYMSQQETSVAVQAYKADGRVYAPYHLAYLSSSLDLCEYNKTCKV